MLWCTRDAKFAQGVCPGSNQGPTGRSKNLPVCVDDDPVKDCSLHVVSNQEGLVNTDPTTPRDYLTAITDWIDARLSESERRLAPPKPSRLGLPNSMASLASPGDSFVQTRDGRELFVERRGDGEPTVVFEAGMGGSRSSWGAVAPAISAKTATVVYDRSGLGRSPGDPAPRDLARLVDDHVDLLDALGEGPFVLVGHSWGGPIVRCAAAARSDRIAGIVLVDQTDEDCDLFFTEANERQARVFAKIAPLAGRIGLVRLYVNHLAKRLPEPAAQAFRDEDGTEEALRTHLAEVAASTDDLRRLRADPPKLPDVPVTIISGAKLSRFDRGRREALIAAHRARAEALPQGRHVPADQSGHMIPFTEPELVAREIERILEPRQ
jgi:pimeloyl-ACP methyl ester carboxylesterase